MTRTQDTGNAGAGTTKRPPGAFGNRAFRWLWGGQLVSLIGDQIFPMALVHMALVSDTPALSLSSMFSARFLALAFFIVLGGVLADRFDKFTLMIGSDVVRGVAVLVLVLHPGTPQLWFVALLSFVVGAGEAVARPPYDALVPAIVEPDLLRPANAASTLLKNTAQAIGPGAAGLLVILIGSRLALAVDVATFLISALTLVVVRRLAGPVGRAEHTGARASMATDALAGARAVLRMRWLAALEVMAIVQVLFAVGPWFILVPLIVAGDGDAGQGTVAYGLLLGAFAVGGLVGAGIAGRLRQDSRVVGLWALGGLSLFGFACVPFVLTDLVPVHVVLFFAAGAGTQFFDVFKTTAIQQHVEPNFLGRVFAFDFFASFVTMPIGQILAGFVGTGRYAAEILAIAGVGVFVTTFLPLLVPGVLTLGGSPPPRDSGPQT